MFLSHLWFSIRTRNKLIEKHHKIEWQEREEGNELFNPCRCQYKHESYIKQKALKIFEDRHKIRRKKNRLCPNKIPKWLILRQNIKILIYYVTVINLKWVDNLIANSIKIWINKKKIKPLIAIHKIYLSYTAILVYKQQIHTIKTHTSSYVNWTLNLKGKKDLIINKAGNL